MYILKYKDYFTCINFSKEDSLFYGHIKNIKNLVNFEGKSLEKIEEEFKTSVEDYIKFCKNYNKIPEISINTPQLLKENIILNLSASISQNPFRKVVGFDKEKELIIIRTLYDNYIFYNGITIEEFENNWTNNVEEIQEKFKKKKKELTETIEFVEMLKKIFSEKTLNAYKEIMIQLQYFENIQNTQLKQIYGNCKKELQKCKKRKEKYFHRFLTDKEIEKIKELLKTKKNLTNDKEKYKLRDIENIEKLLKKYV